MKKLYQIIFFMFVINMSFGQNPDIKRTMHWYFGYGAGIDFSTGIPVFDTNTVNFFESIATISDTTGNLLFYTDGNFVWNRLHQIMPNGDSLLGCTSSTQGALIVPLPMNDSLFYIFTTDCIENCGQNGFRYSIVNINRDNGLGEITSKNNLLFSPSSEKLNGTYHLNGIDIWVVGHDLGTNNFYSFLLSDTGIDTIPVISSIGTIYSDNTLGICLTPGQMKFSSDGKKIAVASSFSFEKSSLDLFSFDNNSGVICEYINIPTDSNVTVYGCSFSPDNSKLYYAEENLNITEMQQLEVSNFDSVSIVNSKILISTLQGQSLFNFQITPNHKIFIAKSSLELAVIESPNTSGTSCNFNPLGFSLNGTYDYLGLPNFISSYLGDGTISNNSCSINNSTFIDPLGSIKVEVFPNPFSNNLQVTITDTENKNYIFRLYNFWGKIVLEENILNNSLYVDRNGLKTGIYLYQITEKNRIIKSGKVIITD